MKNIARNDYYEIDVDEAKNRAYLKLKGFWKSPAVVPNYVSAWQEAARLMTPGFTVVANMLEAKPPATSCAVIHEQAQQVVLKAGLSRAAEITRDAALLELQLRKYADKSGLRKAEFRTIEDAEAWLDRPH